MSIVAKSDSFWELVPPDAQVERLATGFAFIEGPIWNAGGEFLLFNDIPASVRRSWSARSGVEEVLSPTNKANGMTYDANGALVVCEHETSAVVRERGDGSGHDRVVVASHYRGEELNSPNDAVVASNGWIYFTDPTYGRLSGGFGLERDLRLGFQGVHRVPSAGGDVQLLVDDFEQPNGLCFSPDEKLLYINDSERAEIRVFDVRSDGTLLRGRLFLDDMRSDAVEGLPDGMKCDEHGNVYVTGPGGVWVIAPDGTHLGVIGAPELVANLNWGGEGWRDLFLTSTTSLYRIRLLVRAARTVFMRWDQSESACRAPSRPQIRPCYAQLVSRSPAVESG